MAPDDPGAPPEEWPDALARPEKNPFVDGRAAARRGVSAGPLFAEQFRAGESGIDPGLIAGDREDSLLVAGVGYPLLGDLALGTIVAYHLAEWDLPGVAIADCSHTPVAAHQTITGGSYDCVLIVGAEKRGGELNDGTPSETPGAVHEYEAADFELREEDVVERIGESAMGSNTVENVVIVSRCFGGLADDTRVMTVEPGYDSWGMNVGELTEPVGEALVDVLNRVLEHIEDVAIDG